MWSRRRVLAVWLLIATILLANAIAAWLTPDWADPSVSSTAQPSMSADECGRVLRQLGNDVLDAITTPEPGVTAAPDPAVSADPASVASAAECGRLLDIATLEPRVSAAPDPAVFAAPEPSFSVDPDPAASAR
jgi:hypothetical protein